MKKLIFLFAFVFIGGQAFSQMYIAISSYTTSSHPSGCNTSGASNTGLTLTIIDPNGNVTYSCFTSSSINADPIQAVELNQELNNIISQGYKLTYTAPLYKNDAVSTASGGGFVGTINTMSGTHGVGLIPTIWYFAVPWTASGLEEIAVNSKGLKNFNINPNPATDFVDISIDYDLKGESQVVFINEAGYVYHKESIGSISKNEKYNIDISKIPAGKYLVTIVNGKTYTTPQKLIVL